MSWPRKSTVTLGWKDRSPTFAYKSALIPYGIGKQSDHDPAGWYMESRFGTDHRENNVCI